MPVSAIAEAIIAEEESILSDVLNRLASQNENSARRFSIERRRARALTEELVATRRDEEKWLLASDEAVAHALTSKKKDDLADLEKLGNKPYFGRVVVEEERDGKTRTIEYKIGTAANPDCRIIDWRTAPISKLYYEYREGDEYEVEILGVERRGRLVMRRTLDIQGGVIRSISWPGGSVEYRNNGWIERSGAAGAPAHSGRAHTLQEILPLITPDQFKAITEDARSAVLIQGIAGSGKTTVALHRLAWLLAQPEAPLPGETSVIVVSKALERYVADLLPSLGVQGVPVLNFEAWAAKSIAAACPHLAEAAGTVRRSETPCPASVNRVKRSLATLTVLESSVHRFITQTTQRAESILVQSEAADSAILNELALIRRGSTSLVDGLTRIRNAVAAPGAANLGENGFGAIAALDELLKLQQIPEQLLRDTFSIAQPIIAADDTKLIDAGLVRAASERCAANIAEHVLDPADDALMVRILELLFGAPLNRDGAPLRLKHLVVDEVQDLDPAQIAAVVHAVERFPQLTLVGDHRQQITEDGNFIGWDRLRALWNLDEGEAQFFTLSVSHRSTAPIMKLADAVRGEPTTSSGREGRPPLWFRCTVEELALRAAIGWLTKAVERYPGALTGIICSDRREAKQLHSLLDPSFGSSIRYGDDTHFTFDEGLVVSALADVKGLEFTNVLIWNPNSKSYPPDALGANRMYVAVTRAMENLCVVTWNKPPIHLPNINRKLMRLVPIDASAFPQKPETPSAELDPIR